MTTDSFLRGHSSGTSSSLVVLNKELCVSLHMVATTDDEGLGGLPRSAGSWQGVSSEAIAPSLEGTTEDGDSAVSAVKPGSDAIVGGTTRGGDMDLGGLRGRIGFTSCVMSLEFTSHPAEEVGNWNSAVLEVKECTNSTREGTAEGGGSALGGEADDVTPSWSDSYPDVMATGVDFCVTDAKDWSDWCVSGITRGGEAALGGLVDRNGSAHGATCSGISSLLVRVAEE